MGTPSYVFLFKTFCNFNTSRSLLAALTHSWRSKLKWIQFPSNTIGKILPGNACNSGRVLRWNADKPVKCICFTAACEMLNAFLFLDWCWQRLRLFDLSQHSTHLMMRLRAPLVHLLKDIEFLAWKHVGWSFVLNWAKRNDDDHAFIKVNCKDKK